MNIKQQMKQIKVPNGYRQTAMFKLSHTPKSGRVESVRVAKYSGNGIPMYFKNEREEGWQEIQFEEFRRFILIAVSK